MNETLNPPAIVRPAEDLADLAKRINAEHEAAESCIRESLSRARTAGDLLIQAKGRVNHGEWLPWLKANVRFSDRTARLYMQIVKRWSDLTSKTATVADLTIQQAGKLLAGPPEGDWSEVWIAAGIVPIATSGAELRSVLSSSSACLPGFAFPEDEPAEVWDKVLRDALVEPAASYLLRTGKRLPPPFGLRSLSKWHDYIELKNNIAAWQIHVECEVGSFLNWCDMVGIREGRRLQFPAEPDIDRLKKSLAYEIGRAEDDPGHDKMLKRIEVDGVDDAVLAETLGVAQSELPDALTKWMYGHAYSFLGMVA